jgi:hypothetical protein
MPTEKEIFAKIQRALVEKTGGSRPCSFCGQNKWILETRFVRLPVTRDPKVYQTDENCGFPYQPICCGTCGNTHFINLIVLGHPTEELDTLVYPPDEQAAGAG